MMQAKVAGISLFLLLYLHYILWHNKILLMEMQKMQKVVFMDVYFRGRIISFISFCWSHVSAGKRVQKGIVNEISLKKLLYF